MADDVATDFANPAVAPLAPLVGSWSVTVSNARFLEPGASLEGETVVSWMDGGAFLVIRSHVADGPPAAVQVIGRNEDRDDFEVLYADERGVSRIYSMTFDGTTWHQGREDPGFHQRFEARVSDDHDSILGEWLASHDDGRTWVHDFDIAYRRMPDA